MYVYILDPRRILRGESTSSSCGDEVNWGLALRIGCVLYCTVLYLLCCIVIAVLRCIGAMQMKCIVSN